MRDTLYLHSFHGELAVRGAVHHMRVNDPRVYPSATSIREFDNTMRPDGIDEVTGVHAFECWQPHRTAEPSMWSRCNDFGPARMSLTVHSAVTLCPLDETETAEGTLAGIIGRQ